MSTPTTSYDEVPYASYPFPQSHPNRLATVAKLFGMQPKPLDDCRVLELGCASGGNLIPMAVAFPGSQFVGVDLSSRQVDQGRETVAALSLDNVELASRSILDVTPDLGQFDYIVCHGVWSWVPAEVRQKILAICGQQLAPQGVAYISYNTYPGWHLRGTVRDMMVYHARKFNTPRDRAGHARALLDFLARIVPEEKNAYGILLKNELELLRNKADSYLIHEHLEQVNEPVYFYEFDEQAAAQGLQYLAEADIGVMSAEGFGAEAEGILRQLAANVIEYEQYTDFLRNRMFRQTLVCHKKVAVDRRRDPEHVRGLFVASPLRPPAEPVQVFAKEECRFIGPGGTLSTADPLLKIALLLLAETWPEPIAFERLAAAVQAKVYSEPVDAQRSRRDSLRLASALLECFAKRCIELYAHPPGCLGTVSKRPTASPLARLQSQDRGLATNLLHRMVELNDMQRHVLRLADGTRDQAGLLDALVGLVVDGRILVHVDGEASRDPARMQPILADSLQRNLRYLAREALLIG